MSNKELVGNLIGITNPVELVVRIRPDIIRKNPLELGEHVVIEYQSADMDKDVLGRVSEIHLENLNMPSTLLNSPQDFEALARLGDLSDGEVLTAQVTVIGYLTEKNKLEIPRYAPPPGANVYRAPTDILNRAFGQGHCRIGSLRANQEVEVKVNVNELVRRHFAVLAITGGGKGNTIAVLVKQMIAIGGTIIIIDPHSEYSTMRRDVQGRLITFSTDTDLENGSYGLRLRYSSLSFRDLTDILRVPSKADRMRALLRDAYNILEGTNWDLDDLRNALKTASESGKDRSSQYYSLMDRIENATEFLVFDKTEEVPLVGDGQSKVGLLNKGFVTVLALSGLPDEVQQAITKTVATRIFKGGMSWRHNDDTATPIPGPVLLIVEEAHIFVPAGGGSAAMAILKRIASEGRKFGVGLGLVSQRPGKLDSDVLSQCNSMIVLKIVNPYDQNNIEKSAEALSKDLMKELPSLNVGEAVVFGSAFNLPTVVKVDKYEGTLGGSDIDVVDNWNQTYSNIGTTPAQDYDGGSEGFEEVDWDEHARGN